MYYELYVAEESYNITLITGILILPGESVLEHFVRTFPYCESYWYIQQT